MKRAKPSLIIPGSTLTGVAVRALAKLAVRDMGSPTFRDREQLPLYETSLDLGFPPHTPYKTYALGECSVIVSHDLGEKWHLSIAHHERYPHWDEIAEARYRLLPPDVTMAILLPPEEQWINLHKNCFQMHQIFPKELKP